MFAAPTIALTLLGGVIADRTDRRRIMIISQSISASMFCLLAILIGLRADCPLAAWRFLSGCVRPFDRPSHMVLLPQMVPREDIPNAVAVGGTIWQVNRLLGPAAAQFYMTTSSTVLQVNLPTEFAAGFMSIYGLAWELMPVGGMIAGGIAEFAGAPIAVAFGGAMVAGMAFLVALFLPAVRRLEEYAGMW